jgi:hypothetical protein
MMKNYSIPLIEKAISAMSSSEWQWPNSWDHTQRKLFTNHLMEWLETREMYEYCQIVENYAKTRLDEK